MTKCWEAAAPPTPPPTPRSCPAHGQNSRPQPPGRGSEPSPQRAQASAWGSSFVLPSPVPGGQRQPRCASPEELSPLPSLATLAGLRGSGRVPLSQRCEGPGCGRWATLGGPSPLQSRSRTQSNLWAKPPQRWPCHIVLGAREFRKRSAESQAPPSLSPPPPPGASSFGRSQHRALECGSAGWWVLDHCL